MKPTPIVIANLVFKLKQSHSTKSTVIVGDCHVTSFLAMTILVIFFAGVIYLSLPTPALPDLRDSGRSDEPGDTWQNPDQKGFYSDLTRAEVLSDIQSKSLIKFFSWTIPPCRLNYPPEEAFPLVRD